MAMAGYVLFSALEDTQLLNLLQQKFSVQELFYT